MLKKLGIGFLTVISCGLSLYLFVSNVKMDEIKYGSGEVILFSIPLTMILIYIQLLTLPKLIKHHNYARLKNGIDSIILSLTVILFSLHIGLLLVSTGTDFDLLQLIPISIGIVLITTANTLPRFQLNILEGSPNLITETNKLWNIVLRPVSFPLYFGGLLMLLCVFLEGKLMLIFFFAILLFTLIVSILRSYRAYQLHLNNK
ncbi:hypothetical protein BACCIP111895_04821 [Neobacillus rhizosphaerae]|uniref:DUF1648 domain-containing protein n=1 Tax=Neobacillus rhizosphaerae TaxID=2880965 RepID=A0ABM9EY28_9BACI|nr:hypothetical protein [Neobacillus rhizosphaerae]CAH2717605.1 hypothetical protein BACCIP111895_04821 [Neobacillus rhizosphaerae]